MMEYICKYIAVAWWVVHACTCSQKLTSEFPGSSVALEAGICESDTALPVTLRTRISLRAHHSQRDVTCHVTLYAAPTQSHRHMLLLTVSDINIPKNSALQIYEGNDTEQSVLQQDSLLVTHRPELDQLLRSGALTFTYTGALCDKPAATLLVSKVYAPHENGSCSPDEVLCSRLRVCLDARMRCDGLHNCGAYDVTDEQDCVLLPDHTGFQENPDEPRAAGVLVGGAVLLLLLVTVSVWIAVVCARNIRRQRQAPRRSRSAAAAHAQSRDSLHGRRRGHQGYMAPLSLHQGGHTDTGPHQPPQYGAELRYELPPPYTPDASDTAGLLGHPATLSLETPPAYRTRPPSLASLHAHALESDTRGTPQSSGDPKNLPGTEAQGEARHISRAGGDGSGDPHALECSSIKDSSCQISDDVTLRQGSDECTPFIQILQATQHNNVDKGSMRSDSPNSHAITHKRVGAVDNPSHLPSHTPLHTPSHTPSHTSSSLHRHLVHAGPLTRSDLVAHKHMAPSHGSFPRMRAEADKLLAREAFMNSGKASSCKDLV